SPVQYMRSEMMSVPPCHRASGRQRVSASTSTPHTASPWTSRTLGRLVTSPGLLGNRLGLRLERRQQTRVVLACPERLRCKDSAERWTVARDAFEFATVEGPRESLHRQRPILVPHRQFRDQRIVEARDLIARAI